MKKVTLTLLLVVLGSSAFGQSRNIERFRQDHRPDQSLFFYKSTLRMFARLSNRLSESSDLAGTTELPEIPDFMSLIDGIEKVKFFTYDRNHEAIDLRDDLEAGVMDEGYESVMTARVQRANINIMMKEKRGKPDGFVVIVSGEDGMSLIDLEGMPDLSNLMTLSQFMNTNKDSFSLLETFR